jgi:hypothetical protein
MVAAFVPVVRFGVRNLIGQWCTISLALVVIALVCTISEAIVFIPERKAQYITAFAGGTVLYLLASTAMTLLAKVLKLREDGGPLVTNRSIAMAIPMVLLAAVSYLVYYEVFGAITYEFFTKGYYPHAAEQVAAMGPWFFAYQIGRGLVMTLGVLPVIYTLRLPRWQAAVAVGLLVWMVGGLGPLLTPSTMMSGAQRSIHVIEIFTQNFSLGVTATLLLRPKKATLPMPAASVTAA